MNKRNSVETALIGRICRESGVPDLADALLRLRPCDLQSLLLFVFQAKTSKLSPGDILSKYQEKNVYLGTSELCQEELAKFDLIFFRTLPKKFRRVEFSPIGPLGTNAALTRISQYNVLSTIRNSEVISDPTVMLALEAAVARKSLLTKNSKSVKRIHLATSKRLVRLQPFDPSLGYMQHFKCFGACTAGRDTGHEKFLIQTAYEHIAIYLNLVGVLNRRQFSIQDVTVDISDIRIIEKLISAADMDRERTIRNTQNPNFRPFREYGIELPGITEDIAPVRHELIKKYGIDDNFYLFRKLQERVVFPLSKKFPWAKFRFDIERIAGIGYYTDFCFHIYGTNANSLTLQLADGGLTSWTQKLLQNNKEKLIISGFGADLIHKMFKA